MKENEEYIINEPNLRSPLRRTTELTITFVAWLVWFYMILPLITLLLWGLGVRIVLVEQVMLKGIEGIASVMWYYFAGILCIGLVFQLWSFYNKRRFAHNDSRTHTELASDKEVAAILNVSTENLSMVKDCKFITISFENENIKLDGK